MARDPAEIYRQRIQAIDLRLESLKKIELVLSLLKLLFVIGGIFFLFRVALAFSNFVLIAFLFFLVMFIGTALIHEHWIKQRHFLRSLRDINRDELHSFDGKFLNYDSGETFVDNDHEYSSDLGIFGERGIFHFVNRTTSSLGLKVLSDLFKNFPDSEAIEDLESRQEAVLELSEKIDFRQNIQAFGKTITDSLENLKAVQTFFEEPPFVLGRGALIVFIHIFPLITLAAIVSIFFGVSWLVAVGFGFIQGMVNWFHRKKIVRLYGLTARNAKIFGVYSKIFTEIEKESFRSEKLDSLRNHLFIKSRPASFYIKKLATRFQYFEARSSQMIHFLMNNIFFWDLHCAYRIEKWRRDIGSETDAWFEAIGVFDALSSLGNLRFNFPSWTMPSIREGDFQIIAAHVGHPLLPPTEMVANTITLDGETKIVIVTGPNMAGKTTFLKTIGVNIVLALAGAPVCAEKFITSPLRIYTSMKVSDSLDKGLSLFYAELQRLKMVLDAIIRKEPVFFLIDEMLKGTNELDRHAGAKALIVQLVEYSAKGLVATHDLELTKLEGEYPGRIENFHFDGFVEGDRLYFDYILKKGICESSNALELMKKIGIKIT